jgi:hypothetical protein
LALASCSVTSFSCLVAFSCTSDANYICQIGKIA